MGKSWIYREIAAGRFPPPVKIGRSSGWDTSAVDAWIEHALCTGSSQRRTQRGGAA
jgi:prophage regulatory protein